MVINAGFPEVKGFGAQLRNPACGHAQILPFGLPKKGFKKVYWHSTTRSNLKFSESAL